MGWLHKRKPVEAITDPNSKQLSMSRIGMGAMVIMMVIIDLISIYLMLRGQFLKDWFGPLALMNSSTVGSLALVYYGNSKTGAMGAWGININAGEQPYTPPGPPAQKAKPASPE